MCLLFGQSAIMLDVTQRPLADVYFGMRNANRLIVNAAFDCWKQTFYFRFRSGPTCNILCPSHFLLAFQSGLVSFLLMSKSEFAHCTKCISKSDIFISEFKLNFSSFLPKKSIESRNDVKFHREKMDIFFFVKLKFHFCVIFPPDPVDNSSAAILQ